MNKDCRNIAGAKCWYALRKVAGPGCMCLTAKIKKDCPFYIDFFDEKKCEADIERYSGTTWQQKQRRAK